MLYRVADLTAHSGYNRHKYQPPTPLLPASSICWAQWLYPVLVANTPRVSSYIFLLYLCSLYPPQGDIGLLRWLDKRQELLRVLLIQSLSQWENEKELWGDLTSSVLATGDVRLSTAQEGVGVFKCECCSKGRFTHVEFERWVMVTYKVGRK